MFNVNLADDKVIIDEELNKFVKGLKIDYSCFYRGIVVDNFDPERKGRVKVRIPQIYGVDTKTQYFVPSSSIPWAVCAISPAGNDSGTFLPPNIGDTVFVTFEGGDPSHPMYFGGIYTVRREDTEGETKGVSSAKVYNNKIAPVIVNDLPLEVTSGTERVLYKSLKGAIIYIDDKDGNECVKITDQAGQSIIMENLSTEALRRRGNVVGKNGRSQIVLTNSEGDSITLSQGKIHLKSPNILFETDNFYQIGLDEFTDEIALSDIIIGDEREYKNFGVSFVNAKTGEFVGGINYAIQMYSFDEAGQEILNTVQSGVTETSEMFFELEMYQRYKITATGGGYYDSEYTFEALEETQSNIQIFLTPETTTDDIQIVLTWNDVISDMDSHTKIYDSQGSYLGHVFYGAKDYYQDGINAVNLDVDDTSYRGPETTTINKSFNNKYVFYVHRFTGGHNITTSQCIVRVFDKGTLLREIIMPTGEYSENYAWWDVLEYNCGTGNIKVNNTIVNVEP